MIQYCLKHNKRHCHRMTETKYFVYRLVTDIVYYGHRMIGDV
jgi:hypothetical protein